MTQAHQIAPGQVGDKIIFPVWVGGRESHNSDTPLCAGGIAFDPADHSLGNSSQSVFFRVVAANGTVGITTHVQLYNITDAEVVVGSDQTFTTTSMDKKDAVLTIGPAFGNLKDSEKLYECRIFLDVAPGDPILETIELYSAYLMFQNIVL
jgi:hypothetical protein